MQYIPAVRLRDGIAYYRPLCFEVRPRINFHSAVATWQLITAMENTTTIILKILPLSIGKKGSPELPIYMFTRHTIAKL